MDKMIKTMWMLLVTTLLVTYIKDLVESIRSKKKLQSQWDKVLKSLKQED